MGENAWQKIFDIWHQEYYSGFFVLVCLLIALFTAIHHHQRNKTYYLFYPYIIAALFLFPACDFLPFLVLDMNRTAHSLFVETANLLFALIEYLIFFFFFREILTTTLIRKAMLLFLIIFACLGGMFAIRLAGGDLTVNSARRFADIIISAELLFLGLLCITYFFELLKKKPTGELLQSPSFWIVSGLLFYCVVIPPFFLIAERLAPFFKKTYYLFYIVHYISFGILFLTITKAFLCRKRLTT